MEPRRTTLASIQGYARCTLWPLGRLTPLARRERSQALGGLFAVCRFARVPKHTPLFAYRFFACQTQRSARFVSYFSTFVLLAKGGSGFLPRF